MKNNINKNVKKIIQNSFFPIYTKREKLQTI